MWGCESFIATCASRRNALTALGFFAKWGGGKRKIWAVIYLVAILGCGALGSVAAYQTAQAAAGAEAAAAEGMQEAEKQIDDLSQVEDIQLDL